MRFWWRKKKWNGNPKKRKKILNSSHHEIISKEFLCFRWFAIFNFGTRKISNIFKNSTENFLRKLHGISWNFNPFFISRKVIGEFSRIRSLLLRSSFIPRVEIHRTSAKQNLKVFLSWAWKSLGKIKNKSLQKSLKVLKYRKAFTKVSNSISNHLCSDHSTMSMTLTRGLWFAALLDFPLKLAVKSTEVEVSSSVVELDFSSTAVSVDKSHFGEAVAGDVARQMAAAGDSAHANCHWGCSYCCCCWLFACWQSWIIRLSVACNHLSGRWCVPRHDFADCIGISSLLWRIVRSHRENDRRSSPQTWHKTYSDAWDCENAERWARECPLFPALWCFLRRHSVIKENTEIMSKLTWGKAIKKRWWWIVGNISRRREKITARMQLCLVSCLASNLWFRRSELISRVGCKTNEIISN